MLLVLRIRYILFLVVFLVVFSFYGVPTIPENAKSYLTTPAQWAPIEQNAPPKEHPALSGYKPVEVVNTLPNASQKPEDLTRAGLWRTIHGLFQEHKPVSLTKIEWVKEWPTMPKYQMNKTFDGAEIIQESPALSPADADAAMVIQAALEDALPQWEDYAGSYYGRGYVMTTGNKFMNRVFPVGVQMLKKLNSRLPIEIWTKDQAEYDVTNPIVLELARHLSMNITCHRFSDFVNVQEFPVGYTSNYLMKGLAMLLSSFEEVIMLDADNVPVQLPDVLLESQEYKTTGLMLWPDFWSNSISATLHTVLNIDWKFHRTCESGQVIIDKRKHFDSLILANYYNWFGDYIFYKLITLDGMGTGDKDTFAVGAMTLNKPFHFTERPLELLQASFLNGSRWRDDRSVFNGAMGQFNPMNQDQVMFMHMHSPKLNLQDQNDVSPDLVFARADAENVNFTPSAEIVERMIWDSIGWVECDSSMRILDDARQMCERIKQRLAQKNILQVENSIPPAAVQIQTVSPVQQALSTTSPSPKLAEAQYPSDLSLALLPSPPADLAALRPVSSSITPLNQISPLDASTANFPSTGLSDASQGGPPSDTTSPLTPLNQLMPGPPSTASLSEHPMSPANALPLPEPDRVHPDTGAKPLATTGGGPSFDDFVKLEDARAKASAQAAVKAKLDTLTRSPIPTGSARTSKPKGLAPPTNKGLPGVYVPGRDINTIDDI